MHFGAHLTLAGQSNV